MEAGGAGRPAAAGVCAADGKHLWRAVRAPPLLLLLGMSGEERGTWRGSTDEGTATITLRVLPGAASRAPETEGGALVALVWDEWWPESE